MNLEKGHTVPLWRSWHQGMFDVFNQLDRNGCAVTLGVTTEDQEYLFGRCQGED